MSCTEDEQIPVFKAFSYSYFYTSLRRSELEQGSRPPNTGIRPEFSIGSGIRFGTIAEFLGRIISFQIFRVRTLFQTPH